MNIPDKIKSFLSDVTDVSLGYNEINFIRPSNLVEGQIGYSVDPDGNSLVTNNEWAWKKEWLVIATDQLGDPLIVDTSIPELRILNSIHGEGIWNPFVIANSLTTFKNIISLLNKISKNRTNPVDLEKNPISEIERQEVLAKIVDQNPDAENWFWEDFFKNS